MAVDARDASGKQLLSKVFLVEIDLPAEIPGSYLGHRVYVRFIHEDESLGARIARKFNQLLLLPPFNGGALARS